MKPITWDAAARRFKEVITGRIFTASSEPGDIVDGDLWVDTSSTPVLKAQVGGVIYEVVGAGGAGYLEAISSSVSVVNLGDTELFLTVTESVTVEPAYIAATTATPTVVLY